MIVNFKKSILWLQDKTEEIDNFDSTHSDYVSKVLSHYKKPGS